MGQGVSPPLTLDKDFNDATEQDQPKQGVTLFRPQTGGGDQLAGAYDRASQNQARTDLSQRLSESDGWIGRSDIARQDNVEVRRAFLNRINMIQNMVRVVHGRPFDR